ncbi:DUF1203 domain-containing protein [Limibacillus sp. MBR-115]|jgi:hypothetical protein|uniref:DUF1203 domain-containing protein n=1 Tax=Limibacillus sp. MBR-115 TaxID=3156465 RepID=UPI00339A6912
MTRIRFTALATDVVETYQAGGLDANDQKPEVHISDGDGVPCRHCLSTVAAGQRYLILAHRPFPDKQPYAELGPIFLHGESCPRHEETAGVPPMLRSYHQVLVRGYGADNRIRYGTGRIVPGGQLAETAEAMLAEEGVAYLHVRSASNNCFLCRIDRG